MSLLHTSYYRNKDNMSSWLFPYIITLFGHLGIVNVKYTAPKTCNSFGTLHLFPQHSPQNKFDSYIMTSCTSKDCCIYDTRCSLHCKHVIVVPWLLMYGDCTSQGLMMLMMSFRGSLIACNKYCMVAWDLGSASPRAKLRTS